MTNKLLNGIEGDGTEAKIDAVMPALKISGTDVLCWLSLQL